MMGKSTLNFPAVLLRGITACVCLQPGLGWAQTAEEKGGIRSVLDKYCVHCHGAGDELYGDLDLTQPKEQLLQPEMVDKLIEAVHDQLMPPEDASQPSANESALLLDQLRNAKQQYSAQSHPLPSVPIRRMNRFQYNNAVTDLFELQCVVFTLPERMMREHGNYFRPDTGKFPNSVLVGSRPLGKSQMIEPRLAGVAAFPQDLRAEHGFDNQADHLSLSPLLLESFLRLGESITQSPDFNAKTVGIWDEFFRAPQDLDRWTDEEFKAAVRKRLEPFLAKAFRGKVTSQNIERYAKFALQNYRTRGDFTLAMQAVAAATLASPKFYYLHHGTPRQKALPPSGELNLLDDLELASRLSFFLWGSLPDQELLQIAGEGRLNQQETLRQQVQRMLHDKKLKRFCDSFPAQWLQLERIISSIPNRELYPDFYYSKYRDSMHMMLEPLLLFEAVLVENLPITHFVDSDFTYRSSLLDEAYGVPLAADAKKKRGDTVGKLRFERLPVHDRRFGGLITTAAVMTMTSGPDRTKPITRGAWLAAVLFHDPPEPPPADVPPLPEKPTDAEADLTLRERLVAHRARADCRGCHEKIDPLGFALENYNAIGVWRDKYENGRTVDASGTLLGRHEFHNAVEFKDAILAEKDRFTKGFAEHLLSFALARELAFADGPSIEQMVAATKAEGYRIQTLIEQAVLSDSFRKISPEIEATKDRGVFHEP